MGKVLWDTQYDVGMLLIIFGPRPVSDYQIFWIILNFAFKLELYKISDAYLKELPFKYCMSISGGGAEYMLFLLIAYMIQVDIMLT